MASIERYHFNGLPSLNARSPENASKRMFGQRCEMKQLDNDTWELYEDNGYYGINFLGYMARE